MAIRFDFDPNQIAHCEVEGWKAYYDRNWLRLLRLVVALVQAQFHIPFPVSLLAAYYVTRASAAWVPKDHDEAVIRNNLENFYRIARRYSGLRFDPQVVAQLEAEYWDVHRRLVGQSDKSAFIQTMTALHAAIFGLKPEQTHESAELRVQANNVLDTITGRTSTDPARDWLQCEDLLRRCYSSLHTRIHQ
jgi:hypothetical protein